jgi:Tfp pilus assembly protein PilX
MNSNRQFTIRDGQVRRRRATSRDGVALVLCLFVLSIVTVWLVDMLNSQTVYQSALRNTIEYERALYLANAGIHHAVAELELSTSWRGTVTAGGYPASGSYSATAVNGVAAGTVDVTSTGVAGEVTRRVQATVQVN